MKFSTSAKYLVGAFAGLVSALPATPVVPTPVVLEARAQPTTGFATLVGWSDHHRGGIERTVRVQIGQCTVLPQGLYDMMSSFDAPWNGIECRFYDGARCENARYLAARGYWAYVGDEWNDRLSSFVCWYM